MDAIFRSVRTMSSKHSDSDKRATITCFMLSVIDTAVATGQDRMI